MISDYVTADQFILPDITTFLEGLRTSDDLKPIRQDLNGDLDGASKQFIRHFRERDIPSPLLVDSSSRTANVDLEKADGYLAGHIDDGYNDYKIPADGIDWDSCVLSCLTRFGFFPILRHAYTETGRTEYLRFMVDHLLEYANAFPIQDFADTNTVGGWINHYHVARPWYWCMIPGRLREMPATLYLARKTDAITDEELLRLLFRVYQEAAYLRADIGRWIDRRHNGGCAMMGSLAASSHLLSDFETTDEWLDHDAELLVRYINGAFYPDGQCIEQTSAYSISIVNHVQSLAWALHGRPPLKAARDRLSAMTKWAIAMSKPIGTFPSFGDNWARGFDDQVDNPLLDWLDIPWARPIARRVEGPEPPFKVWPEPGEDQWSGYYTMRSDWSECARYMVIDCGPWGTTHQHGDRLSFELSAFRTDFIIDPTATRYAANDEDAFLSRQEQGYLHNTITVDGIDEFQNSPLETDAPLDNVWEHGDTYSYFAGSYSFRPQKPVEWERRVVFVEGSYWLLQDVLTGDLDSVEIEQNFQFEKDVEVVFESETTVAKAPNGARLVLRPLTGSLTPHLSRGNMTLHTTYWPTGDPHQTRLAEDGERPPSHGRGWTGRWGPKLLPAPAVTYRGTIELPAMVTLVIAPLEESQRLGDVPEIRTELDNESTVWKLPTSEGKLRFHSSPKEGKGVSVNK